MQKEDETILKIAGAKGTMEILEFLNKHETGQYAQMNDFTNAHTLNTRLRQLSSYGMIQHHDHTSDMGADWYTITEKGEKVLHHLKELVNLAKGVNG
jgi:DNA-binding HxlR family transcriptional regulator